jgi:hypothetical protein
MKLLSQDPVARREAMIEVISDMPTATHISMRDRNLMADLILNAMDQTVEHMMDHVERARPVFQGDRARHAMLPVTLMFVRLQIDGLVEQALEQAAEQVVKHEGPEALASAKARSQQAVKEFFRKRDLRKRDL